MEEVDVPAAVALGSGVAVGVSVGVGLLAVPGPVPGDVGGAVHDECVGGGGRKVCTCEFAWYIIGGGVDEQARL